MTCRSIPTTVVEAPPGWFEDFCTWNSEKMLHSERVKKKPLGERKAESEPPSLFTSSVVVYKVIYSCAHYLSC